MKELLLNSDEDSGDSNAGTVAGALVPISADLNALFARINPIAITNDPVVDNITILGDLLTLEEVSQPINNNTYYYTTNLHSKAAIIKPFNSTITRTESTASDGHIQNDILVTQPDNYGVYIDKSKNPVSQVLLQLNGHDRFSQRDGYYFNYVQPLQHFTNTPADGINVYSFALKPEEHQPSGTCNFSRIDNATLNVEVGLNNNSTYKTYLSDFIGSNSTSLLNIFTVNYNVLRIMSGMGGTAYSN
jgi:hypothetical protein